MKTRKKVVVFTGAGVSAESGLSTFRDKDGLWAKHRIEDVCTPEALTNNRPAVIEFYNERRREMLSCYPNPAHLAVAKLEKHFNVQVVTQNIDDLHERAGSTSVLHLHGELRKLRSSDDESLIIETNGWQQGLQTKAPDGSLLRPHVVFFGEAVPMFEKAVDTVSDADAFIIAGTSLAVYPAASIIRYIRPDIPVWIVDPGEPDISGIRNPAKIISLPASRGMAKAILGLQEFFRKQYP